MDADDMHDFQNKDLNTKIEKCDFIPPERIREACKLRGYTYEKASDRCDIDYKEFCIYANGHRDIPDELAINFMKGFNFPKMWFYRLKWKRED